MGNKAIKGETAKPTIQVKKASKDKLVEWIDNNPLKPQLGAVVGGIIDWFIKQDEFVKTAVLANVDRGMEQAYADALIALAIPLQQEAKARQRSGQQGASDPAKQPKFPPQPTQKSLEHKLAATK